MHKKKVVSSVAVANRGEDSEKHRLDNTVEFKRFARIGLSEHVANLFLVKSLFVGLIVNAPDCLEQSDGVKWPNVIADMCVSWYLEG